MSSFIVGFWSRIFGLLDRFSLFTLVRVVYKRIRTTSITAGFVDGWVIGHSVAALLAVFFIPYLLNSWAAVVLVMYGFIRVFEIGIY